MFHIIERISSLLETNSLLFLISLKSFLRPIDAKGNLELLSQGKGYGDPGFYFLVKDSKGHLWKNEEQET